MGTVVLTDSSLRSRIGYDIAVRYATPLWRAGAAFRAGCVAGLWLLLGWFPAAALPRAAAQLLLVSAGVSMAWVQTKPGLLDRLAAGPVAGLRETAGHLRGVRGRATADLAGVLESLGIVTALLLYTGPGAVAPLPAGVYVLGLVLVTAHVWSAYAQVMTDASWYNPDLAVSRGLVRLRPWIPAAVAAIILALMLAPVPAGVTWLPAGLAVPLLLAGSITLLLPFTLVIEAALRGGCDAAELAMDEVRRSDSITVHSLVKNGAHALLRQLDADPGAGAETRSLAASMLILAEEARQLMLSGGPQPETVALLWDCVLQAVPGDRRAGLSLHTSSRGLRMRKTDYGLARRVLPDLVTNAWKAGAQRIEVSITEQPPVAGAAGPDKPWLVVSVDDDGPGMPALAADGRTSLRILDEHLHRFDGAVRAEPLAGGGTRVLARWRSARW